MNNWPGGLYGRGMHGFILDEAMLGTRVAMAQDAEDCEGAWGAYIFSTMTPEDLDVPPLDADWPF